MKKKKAFTLVELLVVIAIIAVLMGILMPALNAVKELGKRTVCLNNLKSMMTAWGMYADNNDEKIVSASPRANSGWVGSAGFGGGGGGGDLTDDERARQIVSSGLLWTYVNNVDVYKCPTGVPGEAVTYAVVDAMNGNKYAPLNEIGQNKPGVYIENRLDIKTPASRLVFVDEGYLSPDSYTVWYHNEQWWDTPPVRHGDGMTYSCADGHADYKKWMGAKTIEYGRIRIYGSELGGGEPARNKEPESLEEQEDLHWLQKHAWGELGYDKFKTF